MSAADYADRRFAFEGDCKSAAHKVNRHSILLKPYVDITHGTETRRYSKSEIYGLRDCDGRDFRFVSDKDYEILESGPITLYTTTVPARRGTRRVYFFSVGAAAATVHPLNISALKQAFPENHKFHDALDQMFHSDGQLTQYDKFHKMFKVNRLLNAATSTDR